MMLASDRLIRVVLALPLLQGPPEVPSHPELSLKKQALAPSIELHKKPKTTSTTGPALKDRNVLTIP